MEKPLVSIIVPIYNVEEYLECCLNSVYKLGTESIQIILVNDGSTDNSLSIAKRYEQLYPTITKLVSRANGGLSAARNTGLELASGESIAVLDSDAYINANEFDEVLKQLNDEYRSIGV
jgi:CDP-glycerol glycerophosphotransferase